MRWLKLLHALFAAAIDWYAEWKPAFDEERRKKEAQKITTVNAEVVDE